MRHPFREEGRAEHWKSKTILSAYWKAPVVLLKFLLN